MSAFALLLLAAVPTVAQPSVVAPGPRQTLLVDGQPFYPLGWNMVGACTTGEVPPGTDQRAEIAATLEQFREQGINALFEAPYTAGRLIPSRSNARWGNWYDYWREEDGRRRTWGHARPGVYVEALRWLMDRGTDAPPDQRIYTVVALSSFITPLFSGSPYGGDEILTCPTYRAFIDEERAAVSVVHPDRADRIPTVACENQAARPFWEWNLWYVVRSLRDHPGLLGWYLFDEPEGVSYRHLFGLVEPGAPVPAYTGPQSLPTPDFLHYLYRLIRQYETEDRPPDYQRHPVLLDVLGVGSFFSDRFAWSLGERRDPNWHSGPFDRRPDGSYAVPADVIGLEASNKMPNPRSGEGDGITLPDLNWSLDPSRISASSTALREVTETSDLWASLVIQGQAQLPGFGPFAIDEPLRCGDNRGELRGRLFNDRDLVWHLMTLQLNGMRGHLYYAHNLLPETGPGAEMEDRINRLLHQFREAGFDHILSAPRVEGGWRLGPIRVHTLTDYFRSAPNFVGPADDFDPGVSDLAGPPVWVPPSEYAIGPYGRSIERPTYGQATAPHANRPYYEGHPTLRAVIHAVGDKRYLLLSNAYDARITAQVRIEHDDGALDLEEGRFALDPGGRFAWHRDGDRLRIIDANDQKHLRVDFEPYEVRIFRWPTP